MDEFVKGYEYVCSHPECVSVDEEGFLTVVEGGVPECVGVFVRARNEQERAEHERDELRRKMGLCSEVNVAEPKIKIR